MERCVYCGNDHEVERYDFGGMKVVTCPEVPEGHPGIVIPRDCDPMEPA